MRPARSRGRGRRGRHRRRPSPVLLEQGCVGVVVGRGPLEADHVLQVGQVTSHALDGVGDPVGGAEHHLGAAVLQR